MIHEDEFLKIPVGYSFFLEDARNFPVIHFRFRETGVLSCPTYLDIIFNHHGMPIVLSHCLLYDTATKLEFYGNKHLCEPAG